MNFSNLGPGNQLDRTFIRWYDDEDPVTALAFRGNDPFSVTTTRWNTIQKKFGTDRFQKVMSSWYNEQEDFDATQDIDPDGDYSSWQIERLADHLLREDSKRELCRTCGRPGDETGEIEYKPELDEDENPKTDAEGNVIYVGFPELMCDHSHRWYKGEGKARGIDGRNPILFENHLQERRRREIYTAIGTPDPSIEQGMYNRTHPQGRKVNSKDQRKRNGASFFR